MLAKGARQVAFWTELVGNVLQVGVIWCCVLRFGLSGTGIGFFGSVHILLVSGLCYRALDQRVPLVCRQQRNRSVYGVLIGVVFIAVVLPGAPVDGGERGGDYAAGRDLLFEEALHAAPFFERLPRLVQRVVVLFRLASPPARG